MMFTMRWVKKQVYECARILFRESADPSAPSSKQLVCPVSQVGESLETKRIIQEARSAP